MFLADYMTDVAQFQRNEFNASNGPLWYRNFNDSMMNNDECTQLMGIFDVANLCHIKFQSLYTTMAHQKDLSSPKAFSLYIYAFTNLFNVIRNLINLIHSFQTKPINYEPFNFNDISGREKIDWHDYDLIYQEKQRKGMSFVV